MRGAWSGRARKERENTNKKNGKERKKKRVNVGKMNAAKKECGKIYEKQNSIIYSSVLYCSTIYTQTPMYIDPMTPLPLVVATHLKVERLIVQEHPWFRRALRLSLFPLTALRGLVSLQNRFEMDVWMFDNTGAASTFGIESFSPLAIGAGPQCVDIQAVLVVAELVGLFQAGFKEFFQFGSHLFWVKMKLRNGMFNRKSSDKPIDHGGLFHRQLDTVRLEVDRRLQNLDFLFC